MTIACCAASGMTEGRGVGCPISRGGGGKRRKYQRDRYKYGAIYDSLMYSWIFMPARDVIAASQDESPIRRAEAARKVGSGIDILWFMPRLSFSGVTSATSIDLFASLSSSSSVSLFLSISRSKSLWKILLATAVYCPCLVDGIITDHGKILFRLGHQIEIQRLW